MGIINKIKNRKIFDAVEYVDREQIFSVGKQKDGKYSLLRKDKVLNPDLDFVSMNLRTGQEGESREYFYAMKNGILYLYSWFGENLTPNGLLTDKDYLNVTGYKAYRNSDKEIYLENYLSGHVVNPQKIYVYPKKRKITEPFELVEIIGKEKRVTAERTGDKYYLDSEGNQTSVRFIDEGVKNKEGVSVVTLFTPRQERRQVLWNKEHERLTDYCFEINEIDIGYIGEVYIMQNKSAENAGYLYSKKGKKYEEPVEDVFCMKTYGGVAKLMGGRGYHIIDSDCNFVAEADWFVMDKKLGVVLYRNQGEHFIVGRDFKNILPVNGDVAKLLMSRFSGVKLSKADKSEVIASHKDIEDTLHAFDVVFTDNRERMKSSEKSQIRDEYGVKSVLKSLKRTELARFEKKDKSEEMCEIAVKDVEDGTQDFADVEITPIEITGEEFDNN